MKENVKRVVFKMFQKMCYGNVLNLLVLTKIFNLVPYMTKRNSKAAYEKLEPTI